MVFFCNLDKLSYAFAHQQLLHHMYVCIVQAFIFHLRLWDRKSFPVLVAVKDGLCWLLWILVFMLRC